MSVVPETPGTPGTPPQQAPMSTQRDAMPEAVGERAGEGIVADLAAAGFTDAEEVGRGGFGIVYRCEQTELGRTVAIKVLTGHLEPDNRERFLREEQAMGKLSGHPNIVEILQVGVTESGQPYIIMPYHARGSLESLIRTSGPLSWEDTVRLGVKLCGAVETAHRAGILHRDVKPANVLLTAYGEPQLTDFGVARVSGAFETATHNIIGSPAFTAPEVLEGHQPTPASDVYGLGATLFAALTGHAAFERRTGEKVVTQFLRITTEPVPDLRERGIPSDVAEVIEAAMTTDPAARPRTAGVLGEMLRTIEADNGLAVQEMALAAAPGELIGASLTPTPTPGTHPTPGSHPTPNSHPMRRHGDSAVMPPPTASTKYRPPPSSRAMLNRSRLIEKLRAGVPRRLTVIHGPIGSGKTTLAAQWRTMLSNDNTTVAWMRVDEDDNNVVWFLVHLIEAIQRARPEMDLDIALNEHTDEPAKYLQKSLIDDLLGCCDPTVVVLDDWHRATSPDTRRALEFLLDNGGPNLLVVVTSQGRSGLPLARTRLRDELVEIDANDLRLDPLETKELLIDCNDLELSDVAIAMLHALTEGWLAGLQLASQSLSDQARRSENSGEVASVVTGLTARRIDEYLAENVVNELDPKTVAFLSAIAICERVTGPLASVLAEVQDGEAMLEYTEEHDLLLRRDDEDPAWFRLHPLFAEFLRRKLARENPRLLRVLHLHASEWFAQHKLMEESVDHALAAADEGPELDELAHPRLATMLGLVSRLPDSEMVPRSKLMMAVTKANVALRQSDTARAASDSAAAAWDSARSAWTRWRQK